MGKIYYDQDADPTLISGRTVAIIGFGSQGHAHALNLFDSGVPVIVGLRENSSSRTEAIEAGLPVMAPGEADAAADVVYVGEISNASSKAT